MSTIITRTGKGTSLTWIEADANFTNLNADKVETINPTSSGTLTHSGDIVLSGSGKRITGDFSNALHINRLMFKSNVVDGNTSIHAIPNGTASVSQFISCSSVDPDNSSRAVMNTSNVQMTLAADKTGTGAYLPMTFFTGGSERMRIDTGGNVLVTTPAGLGYGTGAGGVVTQATNKSTAVTLNKPTGRITMNGAALAAGAVVGFTLNNSLLTATDIVLVTFTTVDGYSYGSYTLTVATIASEGAVSIYLRNVSAGSLAEPLGLNFAIIKGATS